MGARRLDRSDRSGGSAAGGDKAIAGEVGENMRVRECHTSSGRGRTFNLIVSESQEKLLERIPSAGVTRSQ